MNFTFGFMPPHVYLHFAGVSSDEIIYVHEYDLAQMDHVEFQEFKRLLADISNVPGASALYEPEHRRWRFAWTTPCITTMDENRVEYV